jgi:nucleotide-binding universal stress UspA family protein
MSIAGLRVPGPSVLLLSNREARLQQGLAMLLAEDSMLEQPLKHISQRLADESLEASLRLRQGSPEQQLRAELDAEQYDLVVVTEAKVGWLRRLVDTSVEPAVKRANCRVVRAKPFQLSEVMILLDQELLDECRSGEI